jgi:hypothetical protein
MKREVGGYEEDRVGAARFGGDNRGRFRVSVRRRTGGDDRGLDAGPRAGRMPSLFQSGLFLEGHDLLEVDEVAPFHFDRAEAMTAHEFVNRGPRQTAHLGRLRLTNQPQLVRVRLPLKSLSHKQPFSLAHDDAGGRVVA